MRRTPVLVHNRHRFESRRAPLGTIPMSIDRKRTETLFELICELVSSGQEEFQPGDLCSLLRERNQPMGAWMVRRELSNLEAQGLIAVDAATGLWHRTSQSDRPASDAA